MNMRRRKGEGSAVLGKLMLKFPQWGSLTLLASASWAGFRTGTLF